MSQTAGSAVELPASQGGGFYTKKRRQRQRACRLPPQSCHRPSTSRSLNPRCYSRRSLWMNATGCKQWRPSAGRVLSKKLYGGKRCGGGMAEGRQQKANGGQQGQEGSVCMVRVVASSTFRRGKARQGVSGGVRLERGGCRSVKLKAVGWGCRRAPGRRASACARRGGARRTVHERQGGSVRGGVVRGGVGGSERGERRMRWAEGTDQRQGWGPIKATGWWARERE